MKCKPQFKQINNKKIQKKEKKRKIPLKSQEKWIIKKTLHNDKINYLSLLIVSNLLHFSLLLNLALSHDFIK